MVDSITITINTENDAFVGAGVYTEVSRILRELASRIESGDLSDCNLKDENGTTVGHVVVDESDYDDEDENDEEE